MTCADQAADRQQRGYTLGNFTRAHQTRRQKLSEPQGATFRDSAMDLTSLVKERSKEVKTHSPRLACLLAQKLAQKTKMRKSAKI